LLQYGISQVLGGIGGTATIPNPNLSSVVQNDQATPVSQESTPSGQSNYGITTPFDPGSGGNEW